MISDSDPSRRVFASWGSWPAAEPDLEQRLAPLELDRLERAYEFALTCHGQQTRPAGEPYAEHLLQVLEILVVGAGVRDGDTLVAALLHDVVEDTPCTLDEVRSRFGDQVAELVDWLTKPDTEPESAAGARHRYLGRLQSAPAAAIEIKLADRLSNVQQLETHPRPEKQRSYYRETTEHIVPLASGHPWFSTQFSLWRDTFRYLEGAQPSERREA